MTAFVRGQIDTTKTGDGPVEKNDADDDNDDDDDDDKNEDEEEGELLLLAIAGKYLMTMKR